MNTLFRNASQSTIAKNPHLWSVSDIKRAARGFTERKRGIKKPYEATNHDQASHSKPEPALCHEPLGAAQGKKKNAGRCILRITSYRCQLLDIDNLCPKYFIDALRYCGAIRGDSPSDIELQIRQEKVKHKCQQMTLIEIES